MYHEIATDMGYIPTGGSDYHGSMKYNVSIAKFGGGDETWREIGESSLKALKKVATMRRMGESIGRASSFTTILAMITTYAAVLVPGSKNNNNNEDNYPCTCIFTNKFNKLFFFS